MPRTLVCRGPFVLCAVASVFCAIANFEARAQDKADVDALSEQVKAILPIVKKVSDAAKATPPAALATDIKTLIANLSKITSASETKEEKSDIEFLTEQIKALSPTAKKVSDTAKPAPLALASGIETLLANLSTIYSSDETLTALLRLQTINAQISVDARKKAIVQSTPLLRAESAKLLTFLVDLESQDRTAAAKRFATSLDGLLQQLTVPPASGPGSPPAMPLPAPLLATPELLASLNTLSTSLATYLKGNAPSVDILYAIYGDLDVDPRNEATNRQCEVTAAVQKTCQGNATCTFPTEGSTKLCNGFEPARNAAVLDRGLRVLFRCMDKFQNLYAPRVWGNMRPGRVPPAYWITLRSKDEQFRCDDADTRKVVALPPVTPGSWEE